MKGKKRGGGRGKKKTSSLSFHREEGREGKGKAREKKKNRRVFPLSLIRMKIAGGGKKEVP